MNLTSTLVAVSLMSVGSAATIYYVSDPPLAMSRLDAQAQADSIVDRLQVETRRGNKVTLESQGTTFVGKLDGNVISIPTNCSFVNSFNNISGTYVRCTDSRASRDPKAQASRVGISRLIGAAPCDSDLFPVPANTTPTPGQLSLCQESNNTVTPPGGGGGPGLGYGHIDLDSYCGFPKKGLHSHRWDDETGEASFDLVKADSMKLTPRAIGEGCVSTADTFAIVVVNGGLSPGAWISINGAPACRLSTYNRDCTGAEGPMPNYTLAPGNPGGATTLTSLVISFDNDSIQKAKLIPTSTGLVNPTTPTPGINCEWRNGAAVVQIVRTTGSVSLLHTASLADFTRSGRTKYRNISTNTNTSTACTSGSNIYTSYGGSGFTSGTNVRYEASVFVHLPGAKYVPSSSYKYQPNVASAEYCKMVAASGSSC